MVFWSSFAKKVKQAVSQVSFDALKNRVSNIESKYVKKDESNTLTQTNTFNGQTNFKSKIEFRNPSNNNGAYLDNFDYYNENYTAFKLAKGSTNMLQIECNNTANYVNISAPGTNNGLRISNVSNPTSNDNAANKGYVDGLINPLNTKVNSVIQGLQNGNIVNYAGNYSASTTYHLAQAITYNGDWFVSNQDNNVGHTPSKTSSTYWVYISAPTVDLTQYLTISSANATYATQNQLNGFETNTTQTLNGLDSRITNLQSAKADKSYVDSLITYSQPYQLYSRLTWIKTKNENNRNWKWTGRLDNNIVPQNLINIEFELRGYDFSLTNQWYESIKYGWYKTPFYVIIWFESPDSQLDDYNLIARNSYIRFISKR